MLIDDKWNGLADLPDASRSKRERNGYKGSI